MGRNQSEGKSHGAILLSIEARFANQIYSGQKKYEFRKPKIPSNVKYVVLVENGSRNITGGFVVGKVHERNIKSLWKEFGQGTSDYDRFHQYFSNWESGLAIEVETPDPYFDSIPIEILLDLDEHLTVPDQFQFVYLTNKTLEFLADYSEFIENLLPETESTTLDQWETGAQDGYGSQELSFRLMESGEEDLFRGVFSTSNLPEVYEDIDETFLSHIIESHNKGFDPYGYFTLKKNVYTLLRSGEIIGFTVTTYKRGNSVKFGPTILKEKYRGKGLGPKLRRKIDEHLQEEGVRKSYSTIPETNSPAIQYLIKSGHRVEAHLERQYNENHNELVFGKVLDGATTHDYYTPDRGHVDEVSFHLGSDSSSQFSEFLIETMQPWYQGIDQDFVESIKVAEDRGFKDEYSKKGKRVYIGTHQGEICSSVIASLKRGDAVKISPFVTEVLGDGLYDFLKRVEEDLGQFAEPRKYYTHVPTLDSELHHFFLASNYQSEGLLRQPYKDGIDMLCLGKMVE